MRKSFAAFACAVFVLAQPAAAITFTSLTTIYIGTGVRDDGAATNTGVATTFHCTNVSGVTTSVRFLVLTSLGAVAASSTTTINHGRTATVSTHGTEVYGETANLNTGNVGEGGINIESLQSGVFCNAKTIAADQSFRSA